MSDLILSVLGLNKSPIFENKFVWGLAPLWNWVTGLGIWNWSPGSRAGYVCLKVFFGKVLLWGSKAVPELQGYLVWMWNKAFWLKGALRIPSITSDEKRLENEASSRSAGQSLIFFLDYLNLLRLNPKWKGSRLGVLRVRGSEGAIKTAWLSSLSLWATCQLSICWLLISGNLHRRVTMANALQAPAYLMEVRFTLEFQPDEEKSIVNSILDVLNIQAGDCDINHLFFPTAWQGGFAGRIWIDEIPNQWVPWDTDLEANKQYRLFITDASVFDRVYTLSVATNGFVSLVDAGVPRNQRDVTTVYVHRLPMIDLMELASDCIHRVRVLEGRIADLEETVNMMRRHLGIWNFSLEHKVWLFLYYNFVQWFSDHGGWD